MDDRRTRSAAFGMDPQATLIYLADHVDSTRLPNAWATRYIRCSWQCSICRISRMPRFLCDHCRHPLTESVTKVKVPLPVPMSEIPGVRTRPARMPRGTYAPNFRLREFSGDVPGFTVHPDDVIGTERHPDLMRSIGCCQALQGATA